MAITLSLVKARLLGISVPSMDQASLTYTLGYLDNTGATQYLGTSYGLVLPLTAGSPMPGGQDVANAIQQDILERFGSGVDTIEVTGQIYSPQL